MTAMIRAIWPSYLDITNHVQASAGITTQGLMPRVLFWSVQITIQAPAAPTAQSALALRRESLHHHHHDRDGNGNRHERHGQWHWDIWDKQFTVSSATKLTVATNVVDLERVMNKPKGVYWQVLPVPLNPTVFRVFGIMGTSCATEVVFFVGAHWSDARIGNNLSSNIISCANDTTSQYPSWVSIRRGVTTIITITSRRIMVPLKIFQLSALAVVANVGIT
ncbi:Uu.00g139070.m01.CDS01 [Anthostomella pinea]|uniref:Uu.00g139070.m01.CDS01 n=1 Tax=Anthostomella pinea TaxID=933095 RepID=A0AAI8YIU9_9PEZI|nr:Uu.00g139070.m01.CDS01 [Anthostomella pinea]